MIRLRFDKLNYEFDFGKSIKKIKIKIKIKKKKTMSRFNLVEIRTSHFSGIRAVRSICIVGWVVKPKL